MMRLTDVNDSNLKIMEDDYQKDIDREEGSEQEFKSIFDKARESVSSALDPILNRKVGNNSKISWGLILLMAVGVYAAVMLVHCLAFFF